MLLPLILSVNLYSTLISILSKFLPSNSILHKIKQYDFHRYFQSFLKLFIGIQ
nr:MAG TPA: hypothetical protein [Caudoviricetes sp.]